MTQAIIVGAGFAGLAAARRLAERGVSTIVLEAADTVGGRAASAVNALGERYDTGGQFLCQDMPEIMALAQRHGAKLLSPNLGGRDISFPSKEPRELQRIRGGAMSLRDRYNVIDPRDPAIAGLSAADWLAAQDVDRDVAAAFRSIVEGLWCQAAEKVPLWYLIDNDRRITNEVHELQYFLDCTMHGLAERFAEGLDVRLGHAVAQIEVTGRRVRALAGGEIVEADAVILAFPPSAAAKIAFVPALPERLRGALAVWQSGSVLKAVIRYPRPFWRDARGNGGVVMWLERSGFFACDTGADEDHAALTFFAGGPAGVELGRLPDEALRAELTRLLVDALGPQAAGWSDIGFRRWMEPATGGYSDLITDMHVNDAEAVMIAGAPPIHFACSEIAPSYPGYVEGALVAGRMAAERVMAA